MANRPWTRQPSPRRAAWYPSADRTTVSLELLVSSVRPRVRKPVVVLPCQIVLTGARGSNGKVLHVRCRCMAGTVGATAQRYYAYDVIGQAGTVEEALELWKGNGHGPVRVP